MTSYRAESRGMSKQVEAGLESWLQGGVNKTVCLRSVREHWKMSFVLSLNPKRPDQEQINSNLFSLWLQDINKGSSWGSQAPSQLIIQHRWACRCVYMMCVKSYPPVMNSVIGVCVCVCVRVCVCVCLCGCVAEHHRPAVRPTPFVYISTLHSWLLALPLEQIGDGLIFLLKHTRAQLSHGAGKPHIHCLYSPLSFSFPVSVAKLSASFRQ